MILRCTRRLLSVLGRDVALVEAPASDEDWYANLLWFDRRKCLLIVHAGTLFPVFVPGARIADLRPIGRRVVGLLEGALLEEGLRADALGPLQENDVWVAKTASRHVLGVMNEMAFECGWHIGQAGGLSNLDVDELNRRLRRGLHTRHGDYRRPLDLVLERLAQRQ